MLPRNLACAGNTSDPVGSLYGSAHKGPFWEAEPEHQDYLARYPNGYTCHFPRPGWVLPRRGAAAVN